MLTKSKYFAHFIWGGALFLIVATVVIPQVDISLQMDSPRADANPDPFSDEVVAFEEALLNDALTPDDADLGLRISPLIKARALTDAGPMTSGEIRWTADHIDDFQSQIGAQSQHRARLMLWNHRNEQLLDELPRLDEERALNALDDRQQRYRDQLLIDPAMMTRVAE